MGGREAAQSPRKFLETVSRIDGFQTVIMKRKISADSAGEPIKDSSLDELNRLPSLRHPYVGDSLPG